MTPDARATAARVAVLLGASALAALGVGLVWWAHGPTQVAGLLLALSLGTMAAALATWANRLTHVGPFSERRPSYADPDAAAEASDDAARGATLPRRGLVVGALVGAAAALSAALLVPFSSLGPRPRGALRRTAWRSGRRAVDARGRVVLAANLPTGGIATVFPEGHEGAADGQVVLVRVERELLRLPPGREGWAPGGLLGYSKVCTHAGCPVGLYSADDHELLCPCHQSAFDVLRGAEPKHGPAAWPLPQLPLRIDGNGSVVADGSLSAPVGPGWWHEDDRDAAGDRVIDRADPAEGGA